MENTGQKPRLLLHCCCAPCASAVIERLVDLFDLTLFFYNPNIDTAEEYAHRAGELKRYVAEFYNRRREQAPALRMESGELLRREQAPALRMESGELLRRETSPRPTNGNGDELLRREQAPALRMGDDICIPTPEVIVPKFEPKAFYEAVEGLEGEPEGGARCEKCIGLRLRVAAENAGGFDYFTTTLSISPHKNAALINRIGQSLEADGRSAGAKWLYSDFKKQDGFKRSIELSREYCIYRQNYCGCVFSKR